MKSWLLRIPVALALVLTLWAGQAGAQLTQPGSTIPIPRGNNLVNFLNAEGESIDPLTQAATTPRTFNPNCVLTFTVIARGGGQRNSFGWYNVTGEKPERSDLHEFLRCDDGVGTVKTLDIRGHPAYRGGEIGFFQATTQTRQPDGQPGGGTMTGNCVQFVEGEGPVDETLGFLYYSEPQWNDDNQGEGESTIHLLIMDSGVYPQAFYFAWEDLYVGGDDDFEDLLTRVEGITCSGGGADCDTGLPGICNAGTMQCRDGELTCVPQMQPRAEEVCNGLDDDCDGEIDNGALCPDGQICHRGACVARCFPGEFACPGDQVCDEGVCVESDCAGVRCEGGSICVDGSCRAACDDVSCPLGTVCRLGSCFDPCDGVVCDEGQLCDHGVCKEPCGCIPCPEGTVCGDGGLCVSPGCESISCDVGEQCVAGSCVDACEGAVCPEGEVCRKGACVDASGSGGSGPGGEGGASSGDGGDGPGGAGGAGGAGGKGGVVSGGSSSTAGDEGCSCGAGGGGNLLMGLLALLGARWRRRPGPRSRAHS